MAKPFYNPETIEAYLTNKLSHREQSLFEGELAKDPLLKNEIDLQKDIISSIKDYRKNQLKDRLNKVQVPDSGSYTIVKIAASVVIAGLLGLGLYSYLSQPDLTSVPKNETEVNHQSTEALVEAATEQNSVALNQNPTANSIKSAKASTPTTAGSHSGNTSNTVSQEDNMPVLNSPDVKDVVLDTESQINSQELQVPKGEIGQSTSGIQKISDIEVEVRNDKKHPLHYQYYSNKLFLYGDFQSKPYELLELNRSKGKELYLYFDGQFYGLKPNQTKITSLPLIRDKETLTHLEELRNK